MDICVKSQALCALVDVFDSDKDFFKGGAKKEY